MQTKENPLNSHKHNTLYETDWISCNYHELGLNKSNLSIANSFLPKHTMADSSRDILLKTMQNRNTNMSRRWLITNPCTYAVHFNLITLHFSKYCPKIKKYLLKNILESLIGLLTSNIFVHMGHYPSFYNHNIIVESVFSEINVFDTLEKRPL